MTKETKSISLRAEISEIEKLKIEAKKNYRTFASYLEYLVMTHPDRKKK